MNPTSENDLDSASTSSGFSAGYRPPNRRVGVTVRRSPNSKHALSKTPASLAVQYDDRDGEADCWVDSDFSVD